MMSACFAVKGRDTCIRQGRQKGIVLNKNHVLSSPEKGKPRFFYGYVVVVASFIIMAIASGSMSTYGVFFKPLAAEFDWTRAATSGAYAMSLFVTGLFFLVTGRLTDKYGPRLVSTVSGVTLCLGYLLMSRTNAIWQLYLFYGVVIAMGMGGSLIPMMATVAKWFVKRRGLMTGIVLSGVGVGIAAWPPLVTHLIAAYGWRTSYIIAGIITLVVMVLAAQFLRRDPGQIGQLPDGKSEVTQNSFVVETKGFSLQETMHTRQFWMLCAMYFSYGFFTRSMIVHIVPHITDMGISAMYAASILSVIGVVSTVGRIGMGSAGDRIGNKRGLIVVFILALVALLWLQLAEELWMLFLFATLFGIAYGGLIALEAPMAAELFGLRAHGAILGVVHFCATTGGAISTPLAGRLFDLTDSYQLAFLIFAVLGVIGLILASLLRPPRNVGFVQFPSKAKSPLE